MTNKVIEQEFPTRAAYAAALNWRQIIAETGFYTMPSMDITPPERYGQFTKWLIRVQTGEPFKPEAWRFWTIWLVGVLKGLAALGFLTLRPGLVSLLVFVADCFLAFVHIISIRVLLFRAGGWDAMLEQRDQRRAKRAEGLARAGMSAGAPENDISLPVETGVTSGSHTAEHPLLREGRGWLMRRRTLEQVEALDHEDLSDWQIFKLSMLCGGIYEVSAPDDAGRIQRLLIWVANLGSRDRTASSIGGRDRGHCRWFGLCSSYGVFWACC